MKKIFKKEISDLTVDKNDVHWDKEEYFQKKLDQRPLSFYIYSYRKNLKISLIFIILSFVFVLSSFFIVIKKNQNELFYLNTTGGQIFEYKMDEEKLERVKKGIKMINKAKELKEKRNDEKNQ